MKKLSNTIYLIVSSAFVLFHLGTSIFGTIPGSGQRAIHLSFIIFLLYFASFVKEGRKSWLRIIDLGLLIGGIAASIYLISADQMLYIRAGQIYLEDIIFGTIMIVLLVETTRRVVGAPLAIVVTCFIAYTFVGKYIPGLFHHGGVGFDRFVFFTYMTADGIMGTALYAAATYIILFVILGSILQETGVGDYLTALATTAFGSFRGGPAKIAVVGSAFFGSISGSAMANVIGTGTITIPLMKKTGFDDNYAGAVEAAASTGGQIMPPIMGATAFVMAEMIGVPYSEVIKAALLPAILYFVAILFMVDFYAKKHNIGGMDKSEIPELKVLVKKIYLLTPIILLVLLISVFKFSIMKTGLWTCLFSLLISFASKETRLNKEKLVNIVKDSVSGIIPVSIACATVGIIISVLTITNLGFRISRILIQIAGGNMLLLLILTMLVSLILGMGLPTTASYLVLAVLVGPTLVKMGVPVLAAHLFILYFGVVSNITPPVALAAYTAAGVAKSNPTKTGFIAFKLAISGFILPFMWVFNPVLLGNGNIGEIALAAVSSLVGIYCLSGACEGFWAKWEMNIVERVILAGVAILMVDSGIVTDLIGLALIAVIAFVHGSKKKVQAV